MDDRETELSHFRQQWQAEVSARHQPSSSVAPLPTTKPKPKPKPTPLPSKRLSNPSAEDGTTDEFIPEAPSLPIAHRRMSHGGSSSQETAGPKSALEHYERAAQKESEGNLGESLDLYRKAFRMDHRVDSQYREKHFPRHPAATSSKKLPTVPSVGGGVPAVELLPPSSLASRSKVVSDLIASFAGVHIQPLAPVNFEDGGGDGATGKGKGKEVEVQVDMDVSEVFSPLSTLPPELLLKIVRNLALADVASFARSAQVCKAFAYIIMTEQSVWRAVCRAAFSRMLWKWEVSIDGEPITGELLPEPPQTTPPVDEDEVVKYGNNWRQMFMMRSRVRFNGIYISTCNYVRAGLSQSWNTPVHIVTYYRYLRFYPNGTVLSLLSSNEPTEVVPGFNKQLLTPAHLGGGSSVGSSSWSKYVSKGRWRMREEDLVDVEVEAPMMDRYLFNMVLRIRGVRAGGRTGGVNKLAWVRFWSWNRLSDDLAEFSLKNDKPFFFSRVGSIEREMGYP